MLELDGMYAFAIWDSRHRQLLIARDRFGEKPLFYSERGGTLTFASELTALLASPHTDDRLAPDVLDQYFVYGYVPDGASLVHGIRQLEPGHMLQWDADAMTSKLSLYWSPPVHRGPYREDLDNLVAEAAELLEQSVAGRLITDVPLGVFLSGGIDSTLVAAFAARHVPGRLKTFTVDYDTGSVGERAAARAAASAIGADHHEFVLDSATVRETAPAMLRCPGSANCGSRFRRAAHTRGFRPTRCDRRNRR